MEISCENEYCGSFSIKGSLNDDVNCGNTNFNEDMIVAVVITIHLSNCKLTRRKYQDFNGIRTHGLCVSAPVL